jgi:hypothetical protein
VFLSGNLRQSRQPATRSETGAQGEGLGTGYRRRRREAAPEAAFANRNAGAKMEPCRLGFRTVLEVRYMQGKLPFFVILCLASLLLLYPRHVRAQADEINQTSDWIASHLPTDFREVSDNFIMDWLGSYRANGCTIAFDMDSKTMKTNISADTTPVHMVMGAVLDVDHGRFKDDLSGHGVIDFALIDLSTLRVWRTESQLAGNHMNYASFHFAYRDLDDAARMFNAMKRLATLCGAKTSNAVFDSEVHR